MKSVDRGGCLQRPGEQEQRPCERQSFFSTGAQEFMVAIVHHAASKTFNEVLSRRPQGPSFSTSSRRAGARQVDRREVELCEVEPAEQPPT